MDTALDINEAELEELEDELRHNNGDNGGGPHAG